MNDSPPAKREPIEIGAGMPATTHLEAFGQCLRDAFGAMPYQVGSSIHGKTWRDVDVRIMLDDDRFDALFPGYADFRQRDAWWSLLCTALSELGRQRTGLPLDVQVQRVSEANEKFPGPRNPLFVGHVREEHRPAMLPADDEDGGSTYGDKVNAPLRPETIAALRDELASGNPARYRRARSEREDA